jgi:hypothetical protein
VRGFVANLSEERIAMAVEQRSFLRPEVRGDGSKATGSDAPERVEAEAFNHMDRAAVGETRGKTLSAGKSA